MSHSPDHAIVVEGLTKTYKSRPAVDGVSFTVGTGEVFAFLGPNGAGKTTTVEMIDTIRTPTSGTARVLGMDVVRSKRDIIRRIGVLPQAFTSFDRLTVRESIHYYIRLFGRAKHEIDDLLSLAGLTDKSDLQFRNLSGGMRQRLGIVVALVNDPEVVFLDEPTAGLDPHARRAVWDIILGLKSKGTTVFLTTHYMEEAELLADTVAIMSGGRIVVIGSPNELIQRHASDMCLTLQSVDAGAVETISRMGFASERDSHENIKVRVKCADDVQELLVGIKGAGIALHGIDVRKPNLEEVFLSLTGEALGPRAPVREHAS